MTSISYSAFGGYSSLTSVYITDLEAWCNIKFSSSSANPLYYADNLYLNGSLVKDLVIPDSVTSIGYEAFRGCSSLTTVNYKGTQEQWGQISIGYDNEELTSATINYNYTGE